MPLPSPSARDGKKDPAGFLNKLQPSLGPPPKSENPERATVEVPPSDRFGSIGVAASPVMSTSLSLISPRRRAMTWTVDRSSGRCAITATREVGGGMEDGKGAGKKRG